MTPCASHLHSIADARRAARRVLPRVVFDYVDGAADDEVTMAENERAFRALRLRPRVGVDVSKPHIGVEVLNTPLDLPVILAPCGLVRLMHPDGAAGALGAARAQGTVSVLSSVAGVSLEEVAASGGDPGWFQLYASGGRPEASETIERAAAAGYRALMVTVDTPALGNRERDVRNGVTPPLRLDRHSAITLGPQVLARPRWALRMLRDGVSMFGGTNAGAGAGGVAAAGAVSMLASPFTWDDVAWIRTRWERPLLVKGVLGGDDARRCVDAGADAVVVSNHGGRQLDGVSATAQVLPEVVDAVGGQLEVLVDGGVRRGSDVAKALALGARAVLVGRPYLYGLAVGGELGVRRVLEILREELLRTLKLLGCPDVAELDPTWLQQG